MALEQDSPNVFAFLRRELAARPGRVAAVARIAVACAFIALMVEVNQIPLGATTTYLVLLITREDATTTAFTGIVAFVAATAAIAISFVFVMIGLAEPALRLPLMALSSFLGMFLSRIMKAGPAAFLTAYFLMLTQTLADDLPNTEALTRTFLWLWVVVLLPVAVTVLLNVIFGEKPVPLARARGLELLRSLARNLRADDPAASRTHVVDIVAVAELLKHGSADIALAEDVAELMTLHAAMPVGTPARVREVLADAIEAAEPVPPIYVAHVDPEVRPIVLAMQATLTRMRGAHSAPPAPARGVSSAFVADAFTNPAHVWFAVKTTAAIMAAYIIYQGLAWQGISTAVTTCFFVALSTLGETMHKLSLRITGALIGGLLATLSVVFVLPHFQDVGQFCLLIAAAAALGGWVATSSERIAYIGLQISFAFFVGTMQGYGGIVQGAGPMNELTVVRDRIIGILLGNLLMTLVFGTFAPESARVRAKAATARALRGLATLLRRESGGSKMGVLAAIAEAERFSSLSPFEARMTPGGQPVDRAILDDLAAWVFVAVEQGEELRSDSAWLGALADSVEHGVAPPPLPDAVLLRHALEDARGLAS